MYNCRRKRIFIQINNVKKCITISSRNLYFLYNIVLTCVYALSMHCVASCTALSMHCMASCTAWLHALRGFMHCMASCTAWLHALHCPCTAWLHALHGFMHCVASCTARLHSLSTRPHSAYTQFNVHSLAL